MSFCNHDLHKDILQHNFSGLEDKQLLHQISNGDEEALATLYDRYGGVVFSVALRILHDPQSAEEIVLDTFTKAWRFGHTYRPHRGKVSTWPASISPAIGPSTR